MIMGNMAYYGVQLAKRFDFSRIVLGYD